MDFSLSATILNRPPSDVFAFFRDVHQHAGRKGTLVPAYDKLTPGPVGVGTRYRELVQFLPFVTGEILTELVAIEPGKLLAYRYVALGMAGELTYRFEAVDGGTRIVQQQSLHPRGALRLFSPLIGAMFQRMIKKRLAGIKRMLESGA